MSAGRAAYRANQLQRATKHFTAVVKKAGADVPEAVHWLCRVLLQQSQPQKASDLARRQLEATDREDEYFVDLQMDEADGLYGQPDGRDDAIRKYVAILKDHPNDSLASQALYNAAFGAMELGQGKLAVQLADRFTELFPTDRLLPDVQYVRAESHLLESDFEAAGEEFEMLLGAHKGHADASVWTLRLASALYLQGKEQEALQSVKELDGQLTAASDLAQLKHLRGLCYQKLGSNAEAIDAFVSALAADANWQQADETLLNLAQCQQKIGNAAKAIHTLTQMIAQHPDSKLVPRANYELAEARFAAEEFDAADEGYDRVLKNWPDSKLAPHALFGQAWSRIRRADFVGGNQVLTTLLEDYPDHRLIPQAYSARATCRKQTGDFEGCVADVEHFLASNPAREEKSNALYLRGLAEAESKNHEAAVETFTKILRDDPQFASADKLLYELGWAQRNAGQADASAEVFQRLARQYPESPLAGEAYFHVGEQLYESGKYAEAAQSYLRAASGKAHGELAEKSLYKLGWANYQAGDLKASVNAFGRQLLQFSDGALAHDARFMRGECYFKLERFAPALASFSEVDLEQLSGKNLAVLTQLHAGQSAGQLKKWEESLRWLAPLLRDQDAANNSTYVNEALYERGWALQNLSRPADAQVCFRQVSESTRSALGARARFMLGESLFTEKKFADAVKEFRLLLYGYGGANAENQVKTWQAKGGLEAGRCLAVMAGEDPSKETEYLESARKYLTHVTRNFANTEEAKAARQQLEKIGG